MAPRSIALLALPGVQLLDVAGPLDVFAEANAQSGRDAYSLALVGTEPGPIITSSGARLIAGPVARADAGAVRHAPRRRRAADPASRQFGRSPRLARPGAARRRRYGSVCSGAFLLGRPVCWTAGG